MKTTRGYWAIAVAGFLLVVIASTVGTLIGQRFNAAGAVDPLPLVLHADTAARGESMSMATGIIDRNRQLDGLFVLDHLSGLLQCWLLNPRTGEIAGIYAANVNDSLNLNKGGDADYVMTTGNINIESRQNNIPLAGCICYVGDGNTGKVVGYSLYYDRQLVLQNGTQTGELVVVARGLAREVGLQRDE